MKSQKGYTLIEMAIVISVIGIILAAFISGYGLYQKNQKYVTTLSNANRVVDALGHYLVRMGRYPCPARMDVARDHPAYGMEDCTAGTPAVGQCSNGICVEQGWRQVNYNVNPGAVDMRDVRVRRGAVPFRVLGLPEEASEDGNKIRMYYAVGANLTSSLTYRKDSGAIDVVNAANVSLVMPQGSAHFVVFSVGDDRRGGVSRYGQTYLPCAAPAAAADAMNCHTSTTSPHNMAVYRMADHSTSGTAQHYDDFMRYYASVETPLWRASGAQSLDIVDLVEVGVPGGGRVGIGVSAPATDLHVNGNVRIQAGDSLMANEICNENGLDCFSADAIGGDDDNPATIKLQCNNPGHPRYDPAKPFVVGFEHGEAVCGTGESPSRCNPGEILRGVKPDNSLDCAAITSCAARAVNMCEVNGVWQQVFIPSGISGQTFNSGVYGASFYRNFICQNGTWTQTASGGSCNCTPANGDIVEVSCSSVFGGPVDGWEGVVRDRVTRTCPDGATSTVRDTSACVCVNRALPPENRTCQQAPFSYPTGYACPTGQSPRRVRNWNCTGVRSGSYTAYTAVAGSDCCTCASGVRSTRNVACDTGFNGTKEQESFTTCPGSTAWTDTGVNTCSCNSSLFETRTDGCPDLSPGNPQMGVIERRRNWQCAATPPGWGDWYVVNNNCGPQTSQWSPKTAGHGPYGVALSHTAGTSCSPINDQKPCSYPATGGYTHYDSCRCE